MGFTVPSTSRRWDISWLCQTEDKLEARESTRENWIATIKARLEEGVATGTLPTAAGLILDEAALLKQASGDLIAHLRGYNMESYTLGWLAGREYGARNVKR